MAITAIFENSGMTQQQYNQVLRDLEAKGLGAPKGRLHHVAGPIEGGWFVVDVWESEEALGAFAETLVPIIAATGAALSPPRIIPVHNSIKG